jgi:membrane associated rhomboid family serine protease
MFIPVGDTPNPRFTPYMTWLLIGINMAVFLLISIPLIGRPADPSDPLFQEFLRIVQERGLDAGRIAAQSSAYDLFVFRHGFRPAEFAVSDLFTSLFLHAGWPHLAGNMLFLWIFGDNVEYRLGKGGYLLMYLSTGVAATLFFSLFASDSGIPMLGASGAISGVLGCYFWWFPQNQVKVFIFLFPFWMDVILVPARIVLGLYLLVDNLLPFLLQAGAAAGVAHGAHIGGFLAGMGLALVLGRR